MAHAGDGPRPTRFTIRFEDGAAHVYGALGLSSVLNLWRARRATKRLPVPRLGVPVRVHLGWLPSFRVRV
ncbi:MAG: hypothetical protein NCW75_04795 [Phycisphaera sp.]|nr:MAG: hypothetical protein NCW75_04795 [Phycisphaera sp.]